MKTMTAKEYKDAVIALFKGGKATKQHWDEMADAVSVMGTNRSADDEGPTVREIDFTVAGPEVECTLCGSIFLEKMGCQECG